MSNLTDRLAGARTSLAIKAPVRVATTAAITLSGFQTIDGVTLADGDDNLRVLVKDQATASANGIYVAQSGTWRRARDFDGNGDVVKGTRVYVAYGTTNGGATYIVTTTDPITIDTSSISLSAVTDVGDVLGPNSSIDNALARHDGTTGKTLQSSSVTLSDAGVLGGARVTPTSASGTRTLEAMFGDIKNAKDWGVTLDGSTDDYAALQALVDHVCNNSTITEGPVGTILIPGGGILKLSDQISLRKPLVFLCYSFIHYYGTTNSAVVMQDTYNAPGQNRGWYVYLQGGRCMAANKNDAVPSSINTSGGSFLEIRAAQFGTVMLGDAIAFPKHGLWLNSSNNQFRATVTITEANPGVLTWTGHARSNGDAIRLSTTGALPTNLNTSTYYYVINKTDTTFQLSLTPGGAAINTSGAAQSGVHTARGGQHIQDVRVEIFGQIGYCGAGIYIESDDAAAGAAQACHIIGCNPFSNFKNMVIGPSGDNNTNHIVVDLFAMDNQSADVGNASIEIFGSYNEIRVPYLGTTGKVEFGAGSINNFVKVLTPQSIGWTISDGGTGNVTVFPQSDGWVEALSNKTYTGRVTANGGVSSPYAALTLANGANSDIAIPASGLARVAGPSGSFSVSGFAGGWDGRTLRLYNPTAQNLTITNDATSTAANRILTLTGADVALTGTCYADFVYMSADSRWILTGTQG